MEENTMSRKPIIYPADYENDPSLRRERRAGNIWIVVLLVLILIAFTACCALGVRSMQAIADGSFFERFFQRFDNHGYRYEYSYPTPTVPGESKSAEVTPAPVVTPEPTPTYVPDPDFKDNTAQPFENSFESLPDVIEAVAPGVVGVINWQTYEKTNTLAEWGSGSGFIITTNGYIVTNAHVIEKAEKVTVISHSGEEYDAKIVGSDKTSDIAVIKIEQEGLTALPLGDSEKLRVGEFVFAIGDPVESELHGSVTFGIISALSRQVTIEGYTNTYLQTDAAINFGNSGGPLINMAGCVIGMNSAKSVTAGYDSNGNAISAEGIGFALPINRVYEIASQLIETGSVPRPGIGIMVGQRTQEQAMEDNTIAGPYVASVTPGGPADIAGMKENDLIVSVDGQTFTDYLEIVYYIREHTEIGEQIVFTVNRNGEIIDLTITIGDLNKMP